MQRAGIALFCWLALSLLVGTASAQQDYTVVDVAVEGNRAASQSLILGVSSINKGSALTATATAETIRRLYGLGIFSDVRIDAEPATGGLKIIIVVNELPKLSGLEFTGNGKIKSKDLREKLGLGVSGYISPYLIDRKANEIKEMYAEKGYFQATVSHQLDYNPDSSEAVLTYRIDEKSKVKVESVILTGSKRVLAEDVVGVMRNRKRGFLRSSDFAQDKYDEDLEKVIDEFHKLGFMDAYLISDSTSIDTAINRMTIYLDVYEGPRYYFGEVNFKSDSALPPEILAAAIKFKPGQVFNSEKYDESLEQIYMAYYDIGHIHIGLVDEKTTRNDSIIDITYDINEGLPSKISMINIVGNTKTKDHVIRREIKITPDQVFNRQLLIRSVRDVMALNYFANVIPTPLDLPNGDVDLEVKVEEKQTGQVSAGAGYNSQDKLVGNVGLGIPNFRGMGQNLSFNIEFGKNRNSYSLSFAEPWLFGRPTFLSTDIYSINRNWYDDYIEGRRGASVRVGRRLSWPDDYFTAYASYRIEGARYYDFSDDFEASNRYTSVYRYDFEYYPPNQTELRDTSVTLEIDTHRPYPGSILEYNEDWLTGSQLSFTIQRDSRNLPEFATSGSKISYNIQTTGGLLGGYWNYTKHSLTAAKFIPLFWNWALAAKIEYGAISGGGGGDKQILLSDRFTPGGTAYDGIVRGYNDGTLTPDSTVLGADTVFIFDSLPDMVNDSLWREKYNSMKVAYNYTVRVRGKYMIVTNVELQIPIVSQQIYLLGFFDAGNSWLRADDIKGFQSLYKSVGFGFRIAVPGIGTLGFDFGYPLDNVRDQDKKWKGHFQMGTTFR